ncbi:MAG: lactonase family protein [Pseudomonadota bacterium]
MNEKASWPPFYVYVSTGEGREITVLAGNAATGALTDIDHTPLPGGGLPLAVSLDRRYLYASVKGEEKGVEAPLYASFRIDPRMGRLRHLATIPAPARMAHIRVDNSGRFLLAASYHGSLIAIHPIGPRGFIAPTPTQLTRAPHKAHQIMPDPSNRFLFVPNLGADLVMQLRFDSDLGQAVPNQPPAVHAPRGAGPRHVAFHPDGRFVYLLNELDASLFAYAFDPASGTLTEFQRSSIRTESLKGEPWAAQIHVTPNGRFLFASERRASILASFAVDPRSGHLDPIERIETESRPRGFDIDPSGQFLVVAGQVSNHASAYAINPETGRLGACSRVLVGEGPTWVEIVDLP